MAGDIYFTMILLPLLLIGLRHPHIALYSAILVDLLTPQYLSSAFLADLPLALISAAFLFISLAINPSKWSFPEKKAPTILTIVFMLWITYTTYYAQFQDAAWFKHDYAIKSILIALFIPFLLDTKRKIDAGVAIIVGSVSYFAIVGCFRTLLGGVEYGQLLIITPGGKSNIAESSTLSMICVMMIPFIFHLVRRSSLPIFSTFVYKYLFVFIAFACVVTTIGSQARTGLVALAVGFALFLWQSKTKTRVAGVLVAIMIAFSPIVSDRWVDRMGTLSEVETEGSALGRIIVWKWTIDYVSERPIRGGGFMSYQANAGVLRDYGPDDVFIIYHDEGGKAFHSIYFEVLGEHGYVGLLLYLSILFSVWSMCRWIIIRYPGDTWEGSLARSLRDVLVIFMVCGNFIGVAFTHWPYYYLGLATCLTLVVRYKKNSDIENIQVLK